MRRSHAFNLLRVAISDVMKIYLLSSEWQVAGYYKNEGGYSDKANVMKTKILIHNLKMEVAKRNATFSVIYISDRQGV
jgi:hypothetical protein